MRHLDENGNEISLEGEWTLLYAYPKDNTPGCTIEACDFTKSVEAFTALGIRVLGVSPDSPESHRRFIEKRRLQFSLISDPSKELLKKLGAWGPKKNFGIAYEGVIRSTFLINPKGKWSRCGKMCVSKDMQKLF